MDEILKFDQFSNERYGSADFPFMPNKVVLTFESLDEILQCVIQRKAVGQCFPGVLFVFAW